ncbi:TOBE domain-containing protein [Mesorhizobium shangrilense]|uniref:TOBE domain-containing protein n=1 Tax=Mesorhizobium shangrilense TaxID=460060 RepID=A0ABV2DG05_9HYPH
MHAFIDSGRGFIFGEAIYPAGGVYGPLKERYVTLLIIHEGKARVFCDDDETVMGPRSCGFFRNERNLFIEYAEGRNTRVSWCEGYAGDLPEALALRLRSLSPRIPLSQRVEAMQRLGVELGAGSGSNLNMLRNALGIADQIGTPFEIYNRPATRFVAQFVGTLNLIDASVLDAATGRIRVGEVPVALNRALPGGGSGKVSLALRPETVALGRRDGHGVVLAGRIAGVHFLGSVIRVRVSVGEHVVSLDTFNRPDAPPPEVGSPVEISVSERDLLVLAA